MAHELPKLPYDFAALEPHIDAQTMQIHHGKHHQAYVTNLNAALEKHPDLQSKSIDDLCRGHQQHPRGRSAPPCATTAAATGTTRVLDWMAPNAGGAPSGKIAEAITASFGSFDAFKEQWGKAGVGRFGSGWVVAAQGRWQAVDYEHAEPGQPADGRQDADPRPRRLGARVLPEVPEPPARLHGGVVERRELGGGQQGAVTSA